MLPNSHITEVKVILRTHSDNLLIRSTSRSVNGAENAPWMMGASLNPSSAMAKEMNVALDDEIKAHSSAYDPTKDKHYLGVPFPGGRKVSGLVENAVT